MASFKGEKNMGKSVKDAVRDAGTAVADGKGQAGAKDSMSFVKIDEIRPGMEVVSKCGCILGSVDHMEKGDIKLRRSDSPDGLHHFIPIQWVARVGDRIELNKDAAEARHEWKSDVAFA